MYRRILVGVDGSGPAHRALLSAIDLAARFGSELDIVTVQPVRAGAVERFVRTAVPASREEQGLRTLLSEAEGRARAAGVVRVGTSLLAGDPAEELLGFARRRATDVIVVGGRGLSFGTRPSLGSTSRRLVHESSCPVLVVPLLERDSGAWRGQSGPVSEPAPTEPTRRRRRLPARA